MRIGPIIVRSIAVCVALEMTGGVPGRAAQLAPTAQAVRAARILPQPIPLGVGATLPVPLYGQQTNVWCWDASSLMVIKYFRPWSTLSECQVATQATSGQTCCNTPYPTPCVHTGWEMLTANGFTSTQTSTLSFSAIASQISAKHKPILYAIAWHGGGGHMLVATGYFQLGANKFVYVNDPWPPPSSGATGGANESPTYEAWLGGADYDHDPWAQWSEITDTQKRPIVVGVLNMRDLSMLAVQTPQPAVVDRLAVAPAVNARAAQSLDQVRTAPEPLARRLGFLNVAEAQSAQLGTPLREFDVPLNLLKTWAPGTAPQKLLTGGTTLFYPVVANGVIRSSVRVSAVAGKEPKLISLGDTATAARLQQIESLGPQLRKAGGDSIPAVRVPALGLYFIERQGPNGMELASTFDVPTLKLQRGVFENANVVFTRLAAVAAQMNDKSGVM